MVGIIYNITYLCPHACSICCVDSIKPTEKNGLLEIQYNALKETLSIKRNQQNMYTQASHELAKKGLELSYSDKMKILTQLDVPDLELQISGGDALLNPENLQFLVAASQKFGRNNLSLVTTSKGIKIDDIPYVSKYISQYNCAFDNPYKTRALEYRSENYVSDNLRIAQEFIKNNVSVQTECTLTKDNLNPKLLRDMFFALHEAGIQNHLLMRIVPFVGRNQIQTNIPTASEYKAGINLLKNLEEKYKYPKINLICSLKNLYPKEGEINPCQISRNVMGLTPTGDLLMSPYGFGACNTPLAPEFNLGSLLETPLSVLMRNKRRLEILNRMDENYGDCKIQSFLYSKKKEFMKRLLDKTDPLYRQR